jgi:EF hand
MQRQQLNWVGFIILANLCVLGCTGELSRALPPKYNSNAGSDALREFDSNRDGALDTQELAKAPGLQAALDQVDADGNGKLTAREIDDRINNWLSLRIAEMPVRCDVYWNDQPLADAQVTLEPEPFLGSNVPQAQGTTADSGTAGISIAKERLADPKYAGVACGWYKIRITSSKQELPARYNTATTLGCEVAMNAAWVNEGAVEIRLKP